MATDSQQMEIAASQARTTTGNSGTQDTSGAKSLTISADVTAQSGTTPTLDLTVEWSTDGGTTWFIGDPADAFTQITTVLVKRVKRFVPKGDHYRVVWTIAGTTPSYTFALRQHLREFK